MTDALDDLLVLDTTVEFWASLGVTLLADFGANVVKVETLPQARQTRWDGRPDEVASAGWDYRFELANRNKRSLALDLDTPGGREALEALVAKADVFVVDGPPSSQREPRLDYASLSALKPDLVYGLASGFGPKGPDADLPALDELAAARTGMMPILPQPGQPPVYPGSGQMYTSVMLAFGVMAALRHRAATGEGQEVDVSLLAGNMYGASLDLQAYLAIRGDRFLHPVSRLDAGNPMSGTLYQASDSLWVTLTMPDTDRWWPALAEITGLDAADPRFDSHENRCEVNRLKLIGELELAFRKQPAAHWRSLFSERQMSADVIEEYAYPANDKQAYDNRYILDIDHPRHGSVKTIGFPIHMSETPAALRLRAPALGEHTAEVLKELLGYAPDRIAELEASGAVV
jgi:crotonobetainyl-CoA:carnitine CoA-transferase CaiB-like acyl-CoA transferase